jgi:excisionase family DNA binding protein
MTNRATDAERPIEQLLTVAQVADILQVCTRSVRRIIARNDLVVHRIGRQHRITQSDLETYIKVRRRS